MEPLRAGRECELILKFVNPTQHQTVVKFLPLSLEEEEATEIEESAVEVVDEQPASITSTDVRFVFLLCMFVRILRIFKNNFELHIFTIICI